MRKPENVLDPRSASLLGDVLDGADIYDLGDARLCRGLEKDGLVDCVPAQQAPKDGAKRQPYFGCIATKKGRKELKMYRTAAQDGEKGGGADA